MNELAISLRRPTVAALLVITSVAGLCLSLWPLGTLGALLLATAGLLLSRSPKPLVTLFVTFLVIQDPIIFLVGGEKTTVGWVVKRIDESVLVVFAAAVFVFSSKIRHLFHDRRLMFAIAACYVGVIASALVQRSETIPAAVDLLLFSKPFLFLAIGVSVAPSDLDIRTIRNPAVTAMLGVVVFAVVFLIFPQWQDMYIGEFRGPDARLGFLSAQGFFDGPGAYSWFCAVTFAFAYSAYLTYQRFLYGLAAITSALFLVLSARRKSIAGMVVMLVIAVLLRDVGEKRRRRAIVVLALAVVLAVTTLAPYAQSILSYTAKEYGGPDPYSNARLALHYTSLLIAKDHFPLGAGLASFGSHASRVYYSDVYVRYGLSTIWGLSPEFPAFITDTFWPMLLGEGGIVSFFGFCGLMFVLCSTAWRFAKSPGLTVDGRFFATFVLFVLFGSLLESTSSPVYNSSMQSALVMIPAGALLSLVYTRSANANSRPA